MYFDEILYHDSSEEENLEKEREEEREEKRILFQKKELFDLKRKSNLVELKKKYTKQFIFLGIKKRRHDKFYIIS